MLTIQDCQQINPLSTPLATKLCATGAQTFLGATPISIRVINAESLPDGPAIFSPNHTHKFDFLPIRSALFDTHRLITWIKARDYSDPIMRRFFNAAGNVPIVSRGFVISADVITRFGRRPTEVEYRALRDHVDRGTALPESLVFDILQTESRDICGRRFDVNQETYADAIQSTYFDYMNATLAHGKTIRDAGCHQHIYPQGAVSPHLTPGRTGAVQAAIALDLPIVPVGISGCIETFRKDWPFGRGEIRIKIGDPIQIQSFENARPFHHAWEKQHEVFLQQETERLMNRIHDLIDRQYRWASDPEQITGKTGIARFI